MQLKVLRYSDNGESTQSLFLINGAFECYSLEDEHRNLKIKGETCIPDGKYKVELLKSGNHNYRYGTMFKEFHLGMLHIVGVKDFKWILIHIGNTDDDTDGCLLVGDQPNNNKVSDGFLGYSRPAYIRMYKKIAQVIESGEECLIEFKTL